MNNKEIFEIIKEQFDGVKMLSGNDIVLLAKDGQTFQVSQAQWDKEYEIRFHCDGGDDCGACSEHGSEKWEVLER